VALVAILTLLHGTAKALISMAIVTWFFSTVKPLADWTSTSDQLL